MGEPDNDGLMEGDGEGEGGGGGWEGEHDAFGNECRVACVFWEEGQPYLKEEEVEEE